jgi:hypothetical protein
MSNASKGFLSGGGPKALSFPTVGTSHTGTIESDPVESQQIDPATQEPKTWRDGNPMMQLVVTLATPASEDEDDDGLRRLFVKGQMRKAFQAALAEAGVDELLPGGQVTVTYTRDGEKSNPAFSAPKQYAVQYVPPKAVSTNGNGAVTATVVPASTPMPANAPKGMTQDIWDSLAPEARAALAAL